MGKILVFGAIVCFGLAAFDLVHTGIGLVPLGLGLWAASGFVD